MRKVSAEKGRTKAMSLSRKTVPSASVTLWADILMTCWITQPRVTVKDGVM